MLAKIRQPEGRGCGFRCVTGLSGSKVSHLNFCLRTQPPETRHPWRTFSLPCHPWQGIAGYCMEYLRVAKSCYKANAAPPALWLTAVLANLQVKLIKFLCFPNILL